MNQKDYTFDPKEKKAAISTGSGKLQIFMFIHNGFRNQYRTCSELKSPSTCKYKGTNKVRHQIVPLSDVWRKGAAEVWGGGGRGTALVGPAGKDPPAKAPGGLAPGACADHKVNLALRLLP